MRWGRQVKELVQPVARHAVRACWNPFSRKQTRALHNLIKDLLVYIPVEDSHLQVPPHLIFPSVGNTECRAQVLALNIHSLLHVLE